MKRMIVLDGNSIMFRAYFATAYTGNLMQARSGLYTNAIYGFVNMMQHIIKTWEFSNIFVAFDKGKKTLRHQAYSDYKGGRKPTPQEFLMQIPYIKEYLDVLGIKHLELDDYEADDIVGSMAVSASPLFDEVIVISGDKDLLQLAKGNIHVYLTVKGLTELEEYTEENFFEKMGIKSNQMTDYKGLLGDTSDNLPGIAGVGKLTAAKLLSQYPTLEDIIADANNISGKLGEKIRDGAETGLMCKNLATLYTNVELEYKVDDTIFIQPKKAALRSFYEKVDFVSFIKKLGPIDDEAEEKEIVKKEVVEKPNYLINDVNTLIASIKDETQIKVEVELSKENYHNATVLGISFVIGKNGFFITKDNINAQLIEKINNTKVQYLCVDAKEMYVVFNRLGIKLDNCIFDLTLAAYIVDPSFGALDVKSIYDQFIACELPFFEDIYKKKTTYVIPELDVYAKYAIDKAFYLDSAKEEIDSILKERNKEALLYDIEIPLAKVLAKMEIAGFKIDVNRLNEIGVELQEQLSNLEAQIYIAAGCEFNISSPKQLGEIIFEKLQLAKGKKNQTGYSTSADVLEKLVDKHPLPGLVLEYRKYAKLYNTYVVGLLDVMNKDDYKVHTIFKQALTLTGRLSSTEPNIQNIPVRTEDGRLIRSAFIPESKDNILVSADYSQIELRILAHLADCKNMLNMFNSGEDLHSSTAAAIFGIPKDAVSKDKRRIAKAVNFGIVYGMSAWGLAEEVHITSFEAQNFINRYFQIFPEIKGYLDKVVSDCKVNGYTSTMYNRRRYINEINSTNGALRQFGERTAKNAPIQGTAADVIKIAMINVDKKLSEAGLKSKLIAQVHDELVIDCVIEEKEIVKKILVETMESVVNLKVKLEAEEAEGFNWDMK